MSKWLFCLRALEDVAKLNPNGFGSEASSQ